MAILPDPQASGLSFLEVGITLAAFVLSFFISAIKATRALVKVEALLTEKIGEARLEFIHKVDVDIDTVSHNFGETVAAVRAKVTEIELWNRDNLVSKATFNAVLSQLRSDADRLEDKIDVRFDRIEAKLDRQHKSTDSK